jgi:hypothetical protein
MNITATDINYLVYRYLLESGECWLRLYWMQREIEPCHVMSCVLFVVFVIRDVSRSGSILSFIGLACHVIGLLDTTGSMP